MKHLVSGNTNSSSIQFLRYFFVGGTSAVVDLIVFSALVKYFGISYFVAAFFAYMAGLAWNHLLCVFWVFNKSKHNRTKEIVIVFLIAVGGLLWTWLILYIFIDIFGLDEVVSKMISQVLVLAWNFGMRKLLVFH